MIFGGSFRLIPAILLLPWRAPLRRIFTEERMIDDFLQRPSIIYRPENKFKMGGKG